MDRSKALLVSPPLAERTYPGKSTGLDFLASVLVSEGWHVHFMDVDIEGEEHYQELLRATKFDLIGITSMSVQVDAANRLAKSARELAPNAVLLRGGAHDTYAYRESCLTHGHLYDAFVVGEGEETIREIARATAEKRFLEDRSGICGLAFWDGGVQFTGHREPIKVDDYRPWRLAHHRSYDFDVFGFQKTAQVMGARGCVNACFYCSEAVSPNGHKELRRSLDSLRREFAELRREGYEAIYFDDPTFTRDRGWVLRVCRELGERGFRWGCNTRVDLLDEDLVRRMRGAGCVYIFCGLETAVPEILSALNKTPDPGSYLQAAVRSYSAMRRNNLPCSAFLIFGCPRRVRENGRFLYEPERDQDVRASLEFAIRTLQPDYLSMNVLRLLPGVPASFAPQFSCVRPTGADPVHGGHYDSDWYYQMGASDLRSRHPIFRAFEGCGSVNPPQMTPHRCYDILSLAVEIVNQGNTASSGGPTRIVVDRPFGPFLKEEWKGGVLNYLLAPLSDIENGIRGEERGGAHAKSEVLSLR
jgi:radical SAM superfamily enzyme YgiQ (UPF0313 family)